VPFAHAIKRAVDIPTCTVAKITAEEILVKRRRFLSTNVLTLLLLVVSCVRDPFWALHAAQRLGYELHWAVQYLLDYSNIFLVYFSSALLFPAHHRYDWAVGQPKL